MECGREKGKSKGTSRWIFDMYYPSYIRHKDRLLLGIETRTKKKWEYHTGIQSQNFCESCTLQIK